MPVSLNAKNCARQHSISRKSLSAAHISMASLYCIVRHAKAFLKVIQIEPVAHVADQKM